MTKRHINQSREKCKPKVERRQLTTRPLKKKRATSSFLFIDKNLCNYPLARDSRMKLHWFVSSKTGRNVAHVDNRITLSLPADQEQRCPTGFDVNVLFLLLMHVYAQRSGKISFKSLNAIARKMGLSAHPKNRRRVRESLALWAALRVRFKNYYVAGDRQENIEGGNVDKTFPPPITALNIDRDRITATIIDDWCYHTKYRKRVELPLPMSAAAQNIVLCTLTARDHGFYLRTIRNFCRKIGLNHGMRRQSLDHALREAGQYYSFYDGELSHYFRDGGIEFVIDQLHTRKKAKKQTPPAKPDKRRDQPETGNEVLNEMLKPAPPPEVGVRGLRGFKGASASGPRAIDATDEDGSHYTMYRWPDGRLTHDKEGLDQAEE
jgi:hypothetical protein